MSLLVSIVFIKLLALYRFDLNLKYATDGVQCNGSLPTVVFSTRHENPVSNWTPVLINDTAGHNAMYM